ncbi:cysteine-rich receptor-like protein kinase 19 [Neltuma alba]|uniref:cysteine-rich receptor-like protein kinase 19 n=1 Tax=Neltuma alba TaxID=207710 RepID=UPI0010A58112|nr:cysteine-rich receptor-like protein kinase 19 [Prosopis alba]
MRLFSFLFFLLDLTLTSHQGTDAQSNFLKFNCTGTTDDSNSTFQTNLKNLLMNISNTQIDYGFYNFSSGSKSDRVNAIALCRGDVKEPDCRSCLADARITLLQVCPNVKEAIGWYDNCFLRYSNRTIFGLMETSPYFYRSDTHDVLKKDQFKSVVTKMMNLLRDRASSGNSVRKFAVANATGPSNQTIYGLVQCTPDLSQNACRACLNGAISEIPKCCNGMKGGEVLRPSCSIVYETYLFFDPAAAQPFISLQSPPSPLSPIAPPTAPKKGKRNATGIVVAIVVSTVAFVALVIFVVIIKARRLKNTIRNTCAAMRNVAGEDEDEIMTVESLQMDFETIRAATNDFSEANKLGQGGFGPVYLGRLYNGQEIAVKRLSRDSGQGEMEFKNEVLLVAKLQHRNLVRLLGFCLEKEEKLLIYEFVPNKSLDCCIFDSVKRVKLNWEKRYKIIEGIAKGLVYLHHDSRIRIVHRDVKAGNVLLDEKMNAKISDFGMARLFVVDQTEAKTSTVVGTHGYMAPEYMMNGTFSTKSDVFSFGVLVLEIISGQKNCRFQNGENEEHVVSAVWKNWTKGTLANIVDPTLMEDAGSRSEIMRCIHIGLLCVQENAEHRPTMASIVPMLSIHSITLPVPSEPSFYIWKSLPGIKSAGSVNQLSVSEQYPR